MKMRTATLIAPLFSNLVIFIAVMDTLENPDDLNGRTGYSNRTMIADENAARAEKRATKAFHPELGDVGKGPLDLLHRLQMAEPAVPRRERFDDDSEERGRIQSWHAFKTP